VTPGSGRGPVLPHPAPNMRRGGDLLDLAILQDRLAVGGAGAPGHAPDRLLPLSRRAGRSTSVQNRPGATRGGNWLPAWVVPSFHDRPPGVDPERETAHTLVLRRHLDELGRLAKLEEKRAEWRRTPTAELIEKVMVGEWST